MRCIHPIESDTSPLQLVPNVVANMGAYTTIRARSKIGGAAFKIIYFRKETIQNRNKNKKQTNKNKNKTKAKQNKKNLYVSQDYMFCIRYIFLQKHKLNVQNI